MNATETKGIWREYYLPQEVVILFNTTLVPQRITIQKKGGNPTHIDCPGDIEIRDIYRARNMAREAYGIDPIN